MLGERETIRHGRSGTTTRLPTSSTTTRSAERAISPRSRVKKSAFQQMRPIALPQSNSNRMGTSAHIPIGSFPRFAGMNFHFFTVLRADRSSTR